MDINSYNPKGHLEATNAIDAGQLSANDIFEILHYARSLETKTHYREKIVGKIGANVLLLTKNTVDKSRIAFEIATRSLEANPIILPLSGSRIEEMLADDSIKVIARYGISSIVVDTSVPSDAKTVASSVSTPVINANDISGVTQILSAVLTIWKKFGRLKGVKVTVIGDVNANTNDLVYTLAKCDVSLTIVAPDECQPSQSTIDYLNQFGEVLLSSDLNTTLKTSDVVLLYNNDFGDEYFVSKDLFDTVCPRAKIIASPAITREKEVEIELLNSANSLQLEFGENCLHILRSLIYLI